MIDEFNKDKDKEGKILIKSFESILKKAGL